MHRGQLQACSATLTACLLIILGAASCKEVISAPSPTFDDTPTSLDALLPEAALPGDDKPDSYLCTSIRLPADTLQLTAFEPLAPSNAATSMMLYGCKVPAEDVPVWNCYMKSPCGAGREAILSGWSASAPAVKLPAGVSFSVGAGTGIATVVLQVHYSTGRPAGDRAGYRLALSPKPTPFTAGMLTYASRFAVPSGKPSHRVSSSCCYAGFEPLHALAFRVHTHELGRSVWMERKTVDGHARIAQGDPRRGQGFAPLTGRGDLRILPGDQLTTTCEFDSSSRTDETLAGPDTQQEMCNMFMMVWSENPYFLVCGNDKAHVRPEGPGGIPEGAHLSREGTGLWKPPGALGHKQNDGTLVGQIAGVSKGPDDTLWVLHRGAKPWDAATFFSGGRAEHITDPTPIRGPIMLQLRQETGEVLQSWGDGKLVMPHGLSVDARNDAIWVIDVGRHQAIKFSVEGEELLTLGIRGKPGHDTAHFCKPTSVAVSNNGDVFVADGYCNSRIMHFSPTGSFIQQITLPKGRLRVPHSIAVDPCANALYVADRDSAAVRRFHIAGDFAGELTRSWDLDTFGPVYALTAGPYGSLLALTWDKASQSATILHLDTAGDDETAGSGVLDSWELGGVHSPHDIALSAAPVTATLGGSRSLAVYVAETAKGRASHLHKFIIHAPGVDVVQLPSTLLADLDLPELEEETVSGSLGGQVVSAGGASKAAADIERAAAQIERAAAQLQQIAANKELSAAQRQAAAALAAQASGTLSHVGFGGAETVQDSSEDHEHYGTVLGAVSSDRSGHKAVAAAALSKAAAAAAGVGKTLGLKATPRSRGPGHYLMVLLAPIGALAVFAGLALALSQRIGAWPNGSTGFAPLPTRDDYYLTSSPSGGGGKGDRQDDPTEVVVSSQVDLSNSVRRTSAAAADLRRMAAVAAQAAGNGPSPLGLDAGSASYSESLRSRSTSSDSGVSGVLRRGVEQGLPGTPPVARPTPERPSVRRASASTASALSADTMWRLMQAGPLNRSVNGAAEELLPPSPLPPQPAPGGNGARHFRSGSGGSSGGGGEDLYGCSNPYGSYGGSPGSSPVGTIPSIALPIQRGQGAAGSTAAAVGGKHGVARASWSGSLSAISELISPAQIRELAAGIDPSSSRRGSAGEGTGGARRQSSLQRKTDSQQD